MDSFRRGSFFTCKHFTPVKTSLRIRWSRNTPVTTLRRHLPGPILWHATAHTPARVLEDPLVLLVAADSRGGRPASWRSPKSGVVSQCSAATPYTQTSPGPRGQRLGVSSRELVPKLERLQRRAGRTQPFVHTIDNAIAAGQGVCARRHHCCMLPQIDRRGGCKRQKSQCGAVRGCAPLRSGGCSVRKAEICVAVLAEENPNGYRWGMVLRMARCGTKRRRR